MGRTSLWLKSVTALVMCLPAAACGPRSTDENEHREAPAPVTFEGADVINAAAKLDHGKRLTFVLGCRGCHGELLEGEQFASDHPEYGPIYASNLTRVVPKFTDGQLEAILRDGTHPERKVVWSMPSEMFHSLSKADMGAIVAYLRSLPEGGEPTPAPKFSALDRKDIASGEYKAAPGVIADAIKKPPVDLGTDYALGRYITMSACTECHGSDLRGRPNDTPNLGIATAYSRDEFERLMTTGVPLGGRKLRMMDGVARGRTAHMTRRERDALYVYLKARAEQQQ